MENITLGQIALGLAFIVGLWASIDQITKKVSKAFDDSLEKKLKPLEDKIDKLDKKIDGVDLNATKNFLLARIEEAKSSDLDDITRERVYEEYQHYVSLGGNSFISTEIDHLKKINKL